MKFISILLLSFFAFLQIIKLMLRRFFGFLFVRKEPLVEDYSATANLVSSCIGCGVCFNISKTMVFDIVYLRGTYPQRYIDKPLGCPYKF